MVLVIGLVAGGCTATGDDASDRPDELVAADEAALPANGDGSPGLGNPGSIEGFEPVQDVETEPAEAPDAASIDLTDETPAAVIGGVAERVAAADDGEELLDSIEPVDEARPPSGETDGRARNGVGELLVLDDEASLACAQIEIAIGQLDVGLPGVAAERIVSGADRAEASAIGDIRSWAEPLRAVVGGGPIDDPAPLVGFLSVCTEGGYEL